MLEGLPAEVTDAQRARLQALLLRNIALFSRFEYDVGCAKTECRLRLRDENIEPSNEPLRQHPYAYLQQIDDQVARLLAADLITECSGSWCANVVIV